ncbi:MAG: glycosyltransferase family 1 [Rariglobus sp.]|jgi:hypothetical protein|nr:glycosyltransferase family 1 [Rariglobus sp.]
MKVSSLNSNRAVSSVPRSPRFARKGSLLSAVTALALTALASPAMATDYYWRATSTSDTWNTLSKWNTLPSGTGGTAPGAFSPTDRYIATNVGANVVNTETLSNGTNAVFLGGTLVLSTAGQLNLRASGTSKAVVGNFVTTGGGLITTATNGTVGLSIDSFDNQSGDTRLRASTGPRTLDLQIGTLTGSGNFTIDSGSVADNMIAISVTNATNYTGNFNFAQGTINFNNDLVSGGSLTLSGTAIVTLDQSVTFSSVTISGTALTAGFHSFSSLNSSYGNFFTDGGSGGITVATIPEPSTYAALFGAAALGTVVGIRRRRR